MTKLTLSQQRVIDSKNKNLLVSAGAGSGKTFSMIQKISDIIVRERVPVANLLVVTFTKAAAAEMKSKILTVLSEIPEKDDYLKEQLSEVAVSDISTLHSFCTRLLRTYFYEAGLDPAFSVIDENESSVLKQKCLDKLFQQKLQEADEDFLDISDIFARNRKDDSFRNILLRFYEFLITRPDGEKWFKDTIKKSYSEDFDTNLAAVSISNYVAAKAKEYRKRIAALLDEAIAARNPKLVEILNQLDINLLKIRDTSKPSMNLAASFYFENVNNMPRGIDEELGVRIKNIKTEIKKLFDRFQEEFTDSDINVIKQKLKVSRRRVDVLYNLVVKFNDLYAAEKKERAVCDFSDLEQYTLKILNNKDIIKELHGKYRYVFVDEYQDTNGIQEAILTKIAKDKNMFMVGDFKQSIYGFRLCEPEFFIEKFDRFKKDTKDNEVINLNDNFRSHPEILGFVNGVFSRIMTKEFCGLDYKNEALLVSGHSEFKKASSELPVVKINIIKKDKKVALEEDDETSESLDLYSVLKHKSGEDDEVISGAVAEGKIIAGIIGDIVGKEMFVAGGEGEVRKIFFSDITVLCAKRGEYLNKALKQLSKNGIPYNTDAAEDLFEDEYMNLLKNLLMLLDNSKLDYPLLCVMQSGLFGFSDNELAEIRLSAGDSRFFYEAVTCAKTNKKLSSEIRNKLNKLFAFLEKFTFCSTFLTVDELVNRIISETDFKNLMILSGESEKSQQRLDQFLDLLKGKTYNENLARYIANQDLINTAFQSHEAANSVNVTSIHKSKGLDYPVVILMGIGREFNREDSLGDFIINKNIGVGINYFNERDRIKGRTIVYNACRVLKEQENLQEQARLLYVALTRAKNHLFIVGVGDVSGSDAEFKTPTSHLDFIGRVIRDKNAGKLEKSSDFTLKHDSLSVLSSGETEDKSGKVTIGKPNPLLVSKLKEVFNYKYPYEKSCRVPVKSTVTEILAKEKETYEFVPAEFSLKGKGLKSGITYHKILQKVGLARCPAEKLAEKVASLVLDGTITKEDLALVDINKIYTCIMHPEIRALLDGNRYVQEQEFMGLFKHSDFHEGDTTDDEVVVQGIVDVIVFEKNAITIIDYKSNHIRDMQKLKDMYEKQLNLYAHAASEIYKLPVKRKIIYSIFNDKLIDV